MANRVFLFGTITLLVLVFSALPGKANAVNAGQPVFPTLQNSMMKHRVGLMTDTDTVEREEEAISPDGFSVKERQQMEEMKEKFQFQAEVSRLLDILINSLYQKKEIFLRELISNASDALDKIRFIGVSDDSALGEGETRELDIRVRADKEARTLSIVDKGIGMTKQDLVNNLGTIAKSGTTNFLDALKSGADLSLIGQFGVGFYSVFLAADRVQVISKHNDDKQHIWESTADNNFSVMEDPRGDTLGRGTEVKLFLKEDADEFLEDNKLRELISRYSEFINFPIYVYSSRTETIDVPVDEESTENDQDKETADLDEDDQEEDDEDSEENDQDSEENDEEKKPKTKKETVTKWDWQLVNEQKALWARKPSEVTEEEYENFYKSISKDHEGPLTKIHFTAEGEIEFRAILFVPKRAPYDLYESYYGKNSALRLYVRKVLITDEFEELMPRYLNFIRGVVDSDDLPLNVSRETLQHHKVLKVMGKKLVRKALEMLRKLAEDGEKEKQDESHEGDDVYTKFWKEFGKSIKLGTMEDASNRSKLSKLLRYVSANSNGKLISLQEYVDNMKEDQEVIYYIAGENKEAVEKSPMLERLRKRGYDVIYMIDPIDEYTLQNLSEFEGKKLQSVTKEGLKLGETDEEKKRLTAYKSKFEPLTDYLKETLKGKVEKVTISNRLEETPCVLVTSQYGYSANMERIMRAQAFSDQERTKMMLSKKTMELNPRHPIIENLLHMVQDHPADEQTKNYASLIYDTALLNSGFYMDEPTTFASRMYSLMKDGMRLNSLDLLDEIEVPEEEDVEDDLDEEDKDEL